MMPCQWRRAIREPAQVPDETGVTKVEERQIVNLASWWAIEDLNLRPSVCKTERQEVLEDLI